MENSLQIVIYLFALFNVMDSLKPNNMLTLTVFVGSDIFFEIIEPEDLAYSYKLRPALDFGVTFNDTFHFRRIPLVVAEPSLACQRLTNSKEIRGKVALVERGECSFVYKALISQQAGAAALIVTDSDKTNDDKFIEMVDDETFREVRIPAGFLVGKNGYMIRSTLKRLNRKFALINIPVNFTTLDFNQMNQPPWIQW